MKNEEELKDQIQCLHRKNYVEMLLELFNIHLVLEFEFLGFCNDVFEKYNQKNYYYDQEPKICKLNLRNYLLTMKLICSEQICIDKLHQLLLSLLLQNSVLLNLTFLE